MPRLRRRSLARASRATVTRCRAVATPRQPSRAAPRSHATTPHRQVDWLPLVVRVASGSAAAAANLSGVDGVDVWDALVSDGAVPSPRTEARAPRPPRREGWSGSRAPDTNERITANVAARTTLQHAHISEFVGS